MKKKHYCVMYGSRECQAHQFRYYWERLMVALIDTFLITPLVWANTILMKLLAKLLDKKKG